MACDSVSVQWRNARCLVPSSVITQTPKWNIAELGGLEKHFDVADNSFFVKSITVFPVPLPNPEDNCIFKKRFILLMLAIKWLITQPYIYSVYYEEFCTVLSQEWDELVIINLNEAVVEYSWAIFKVPILQ